MESIDKKGNNMKRIFAIVALIIITLWIGATVVTAVFPVPMKSVLFPIFAIGCVILPIMAWIVLWAISVFSGKKNIASFRSEDMEKTMKEAISKLANSDERMLVEVVVDKDFATL